VGEVKAPWPVKLIMPMFSGVPELFDVAEQVLVEEFGPVDHRSPRMPFAYTHHYDDEFGSRLQRQFVSFERLIGPGDLGEIKVRTNALEGELGADGRRRINLDPGYISEAKLVLATTKDHGHRVYIGHGIYAEVTLTYRDRDFRPWPWTYPDYRSEPYLQILRTIRGIYVAQLRHLRHK
jgi:hypothetical protein